MHEQRLEDRLLDRGIIIIKPKKPLVNWVNEHSPDEAEHITIEMLQGDCSTYLIPPLGESQELDEFVELIYEDLFEHELESWLNEDALWPQNRDFAMFNKWFQVEYHSMVFDLVEDVMIEHEMPETVQ